MKRKRGKTKFLEILNSKPKPFIRSLILIIFFLAIVVAGDVIVKEGSMNIGDDFNASGILFVDSSSGNVGIGTSSPAEDLHIEDGYANLLINATTDNAGILIRNPVDEYGSIVYYHGATNLWNIGTLANDARLAFRQAGTTEVMTLHEDGNVGIGEVTPDDELHILGVNPNFQIEDNTYTNTVGLHLRVGSKDARITHTYGLLKLAGDAGDNVNIELSASGQTNQLWLDVDGNVGIGTSSPGAKLSINGGLHVGGDSDPGDNNLDVDGISYIGWEKITSNCGDSVDYCRANCSSGKKILGGGGWCIGDSLEISYPLDTAWEVYCDSTSTSSVYAYAICARVGD